MSEDSRKIAELVDAIVEETQVDWDRVIETAADEDERDLLQAVASLARIQEAANGGEGEADPPLRWGTLDIVATLGQGSFGTVYRARDPILNLDVALKVLRPDVVAGRARILEEGRALARLRHPNIVRVYGADKRDRAIGLRMELLEGESLHTIVTRDGPFGAHEAARIGIDLCRALSAVHTAGFVHRDVKAQNVMREPDARIVLMDLGASTSFDAEEHGSAIGTPVYMAPELLAGRAAAPTTDLYALGVLLFYLVTGTYPVDGPVGGLASAHRDGRVRRLADAEAGVPDAFCAVVDRCLEASSEDRFPDARSVAGALAAARTGGSTGDSTTSGIRHNLPPQLTRFVGREHDVECVSGRLAESRLVTLTGVGGGGKTRLALETATSLLESYPGGVHVAELAGVSENERVIDAVATALGATTRGADPLTELVRGLSDSPRMLLVVDNCEHVLEGARDVVDALLRGTPGVHVLATSREPLRTTGELTVDVRPLDVPSTGVETGTSSVPAVPTALASGAARLFVDAAVAARHDFDVTPENVRSVVDICRRLDGLPLALELAGAAVRHFPVSDIATRLRDSFRVLDAAPGTSLPHHRTLEASIAWSYDVLDAAERRALDCLSVFVGGWTLDGAEALLPAATDIDESRVLRTLSNLVSKSLVQLHMDNESGGARYRMLDTIRSFAAEKLRASAREDTVYPAFLDFCTDLAERLGPELRRGSQHSALVRLNAEEENFRAALRHAIDRDDVARGRRLAGALGSYWLTKSRHAEGLRVCEALLGDAAGANGDTLDRARVAEWSGVFWKKLGEHDRGWARTRESLSIRRKLGDRRGEAGSLNSLGITCYERGEYERAMAFYEESLAIRRDIEDELGIAQVLNNMGILHGIRDETDAALRLYEEALAIHRRLENDWGVAMVLNSIGVIRANRKDYDGARDAFEHALDIHRSLGDRWGVTVKQMNLGHLARWQGRLDDARRCFEEAMAVQRDIGSRSGLTNSLLGLALVEAEEGDLVAAARHVGRVDALLETHGLSLQPDEGREREALVATLRKRLGEAPFERERRLGHDRPLPPL